MKIVYICECVYDMYISLSSSTKVDEEKRRKKEKVFQVAKPPFRPFYMIIGVSQSVSFRPWDT